MAHSSQCSRTKNHTQTIEGEYLDPQKLMLLLRAVYGTSEGMNNFRVELRLNRYQIYLSRDVTNVRALTEAQIKDCRASGRRRF
jgi:hypothetical protein